MQREGIAISKCVLCILCIFCVFFAVREADNPAGDPRNGNPRSSDSRSSDSRSSDLRIGDPHNGANTAPEEMKPTDESTSAGSAGTGSGRSAAGENFGQADTDRARTRTDKGSGFTNFVEQSYLSMEVSPRETPVIYVTIAEAVEASQGNGKMTLAFFSNNFDTWCREANRYLIEDAVTCRSISTRVNLCFVDTDRRPGDLRKYRIWLPPTVLLLDSSGVEVARREGRVEQEEFLSWLRKRLLGER